MGPDREILAPLAKKQVKWYWKFFKWVLILTVIITAYYNIGLLYGKWIDYISWYPTSVAAKVLSPGSPMGIPPNCPFDAKTPKVDPQLKQQYGSFEQYTNRAQTTGQKIIKIYAWPFLFLMVYVACFLSWICWFLYQGILAGMAAYHYLAWFFFGGGLLELLHLAP